jgi:hypothetical protein
MRAQILLVSLAFSAAAQQAPVANQEVPDNIAPHAAPAQPLPYSHKTHIALSLECRRCHTNPDAGNQMTFPATTVCMTCHSTIAKDKPTIVKLAEFARTGQAIPWQRVYQVTPGVTWSHRKHLAAGLQCVMCHGQVAQMDVMAQNTSVTSMASCISCHESHQASTACQTCHAWPQG